MILPRNQRLYALKRADQFWAGGSIWVDDVRRASVFPERSAKSKMKIDIGMDCEMVEVVPIEKT